MFCKGDSNITHLN